MATKLNPRELAICAALATVSGVIQLIHIGYQSPQFGMWIDLVASSWIIAFFLFGMHGALLTSFTGAIIITLIAPETWLGAIMKWSATLPLWLMLGVWQHLIQKNPSCYEQIRILIIPAIIALLIRGIIALPLNYYFAVPIWLNMSPSKAIATIPWYLITAANILQGGIDITIAWLITFRFKLIRFAKWEQ